MALTTKYFKPFSVTWWCSLVPVVAGIVVATAHLHGWTGIVTAINLATGDTAPAVLINVGLAGIGLRGAIQ